MGPDAGGPGGVPDSDGRPLNGDPTVAGTLFGLGAGAVGVVVSGVMLARSGDTLAARTRLGGLWFGLVFLAIATSLPELLTAGSAVWIGAPDLAAGDLFGSNMANMLILALVALVPRTELFRRAALDQALVASHAISLTSLAAAFIVLTAPPLDLGIGVGPGALLILVAWAAGSRTIYRHSALPMDGSPDPSAPDEKRGKADGGLAGPILRFVLATVVVILAAPLFAVSAEHAVELTGLGEGFIGAIVLGVATSLPEAATSLAAVRIRAYDLAVANLFGSNAVNMVMFVPLDLIYTEGALLASVGDIHVFAAFASIVMMSLALAAIVFQVKRRSSMLEPSSGLIVLVYVLAMAVMFGWRG